MPECIEVSVFDDDIALAWELLRSMPPNRRTFATEEERLIGFIGEIVVSKYLNVELSSPDVYDWDFLLPTKYDDKKVDLKTTKTTQDHPPYADWEGSVSNYVLDKCDMYMFARLLVNEYTYEPMRRLWIMGFVTSKDFGELAIFTPKGTISGSNKNECQSDCHKIEYDKLWMPDKLRKKGTEAYL